MSTCDFQQCGILTNVDSDEPLQPPLSLETSNYVQSVAKHSYNIQVTSKGSDQTAHMRRLISAFTGHTYHIAGTLMWWLNYLSFKAYFGAQKTVNHSQIYSDIFGKLHIYTPKVYL